MSELDIIEMHKNCLDFLLKWQLEHENFYFVTRKRKDDKLKKGMYFRGGKDYLVLSFWKEETKKRNALFD